jgi:hypothetical protein
MKNTFHKRSGTSVSGFDTYSLGFELPASNQLHRINKKLDRWENHAKLSAEKKMQRDLWAKEILKKEEKKYQKIDKMNELKNK